MLEWLQQNASTILIIAVLVIVVLLIIRGMIMDKKRGKHSCGSSCSCCPMSEKCHSRETIDTLNTEKDK